MNFLKSLVFLATCISMGKDGLSLINSKGSNYYLITCDYKFMKVFWLLCFLTIIVSQTYCRKLKKKVQISNLGGAHETVYLSKFNIGSGEGTINVRYKMDRSDNMRDFRKLYMRVGIVKDSNYEQFAMGKNCQQKQAHYLQSQEVKFSGYQRGSIQFNITEDEQHIYYIYFYDCKSEIDREQLKGTVIFDLDMKNNGSHFGADEEYFTTGYLLVIAVWLLLLIFLFMPILKSVSKSDDLTRLFLYGGFVILGLAYFYRFLDVLMVYYNGEGVDLLRVIYESIKHVVEGIIITMLVSIAWGWSLTHLRHQPYYIIMGTVTTILSIMFSILESFSQEMEQEHHQFDNTRGIILVIIRIIICLVFFIGISKSLAGSVGRIKYFLKKFALWAGMFLFSWPLAVLIAQLFLPNYMHRQFVTLIDETSHLIATAYLCRLHALPNNAYMKINLKQEDGILPDYISRNI